MKAPPPHLYAALGEIDRWWNGSHSYSGQAANLSLARQAGGCFCERWGNNSVEHARVVYARSRTGCFASRAHSGRCSRWR